MAKLGPVLERQFKKLGITITDELKPLISADIDLPEMVARQIDQGLLTIEAAKTNPEVNKALRQSILGGADARMDEIIKEMGLTVGEDFINEKNSYEKISMLAKMLHQHGLKKGEGNSKEDLSEILKNERAGFSKKEMELQKQLKQLTDGREGDRTEFALQKKLLGKDYAFPKDMNNDIKMSAASSVINMKLKALGLQARLNDAGSLVITDKDGNKAYTDKHEAIDDVDSFFDGILTENKLLNVNGGTHQQQSPPPGGGGFIPNMGATGNLGVVAQIDAQLEAMK